MKTADAMQTAERWTDEENAGQYDLFAFSCGKSSRVAYLHTTPLYVIESLLDSFDLGLGCVIRSYRGQIIFRHLQNCHPVIFLLSEINRLE